MISEKVDKLNISNNNLDEMHKKKKYRKNYNYNYMKQIL